MMAALPPGSASERRNPSAMRRDAPRQHGDVTVYLLYYTAKKAFVNKKIEKSMRPSVA
jgi:hypothetical protein